MVKIKYGPLIFNLTKTHFKPVKNKVDYFEYVKFFYSLPISEYNYTWNDIEYKYIDIFERSSNINFKVFVGLDIDKQRPIIIITKK